MQACHGGTNVTSGGVLEVGAIGWLGGDTIMAVEKPGWVFRRPNPPRPALPRPSSFSITRTWRVMYERTLMYA